MKIVDSNFKWAQPLTLTNKPNMIILHHAESKSCTVNDIHKWHLENGWSGIGYHYFIRKDGTIYKGRPDNAIGSQCKGHNTNTLGICAEGNYMTEQMPIAQKNAIIELCKMLCAKYKITKVIGHKEAPYSTDCPGVKYPLQEIKFAIFAKPVAKPADNIVRTELLVTAPKADAIDKTTKKLVKTYKANDALTAIGELGIYWILNINRQISLIEKSKTKKK